MSNIGSSKHQRESTQTHKDSPGAFALSLKRFSELPKVFPLGTRGATLKAYVQSFTSTPPWWIYNKYLLNIMGTHVKNKTGVSWASSVTQTHLRLHSRAPRLYPESWTMPLLKFQESTDGEAIMFFPHHSLYPWKQLPPAELRWQNSQSTQKL